MVLIKLFLILSVILLLNSCNKGKTDEEMAELWSKAQTTGEIIKRSGTKFDSGVNKERALADAENRIMSGGGLLGDGGITSDGLFKNQESEKVGKIGMPINSFLWQGAIETINFMPLNSADPIGGTILTDWYSTSDNENERCKLNIFITGAELKTQNLKVTSFCQKFDNGKWVNKNTDENNNLMIENAILNKAKKLRLQSS
mgnify:CR=1 FL=1|tara:strand:+ start:948 stop:1550 length:603 start_codon:yes stop_codon:yes gene_type:complete